MSTKLVLVFVVLALVASAGTATKMEVYRFTLKDPAALNGLLLQPGDYKLVVHDNRATVTGPDGQTAEVTVKKETAPSKFDTTALTIEVKNSKPEISEIDFGGSKTKLYFAQ